MPCWIWLLVASKRFAFGVSPGASLSSTGVPVHAWLSSVADTGGAPSPKTFNGNLLMSALTCFLTSAAFLSAPSVNGVVRNSICTLAPLFVCLMSSMSSSTSDVDASVTLMSFSAREVNSFATKKRSPVSISKPVLVFVSSSRPRLPCAMTS